MTPAEIEAAVYARFRCPWQAAKRCIMRAQLMRAEIAKYGWRA